MSAENVDRPKRLFISATTHDLQSYRKLVTAWAKSKGYIPVVQEDFPAYPHDYSVKDVLRENLSSCDAVIHLTGLYYGAEPTGYVSPESRRSYTQLEYDLAKTLRRQLFVLIASEDYQPDDPITNQSQDHYQFQRQHRQRIRDSGGMRYSFSNHEELSQQLQKIEVTGMADRPNNLPVVGSLFKGRDDFLLNLRSKVEGKVGSALVIATKHTIHGLGGIGKTRLAIEYANRYSEHYTALLFVVADSPESLRANIANLCGALRIDEPEPAKQYDAAIKWLQQNPGWFLIVDKVDTKEAARAVEESILGKLKEGHILVTSRLSAWRNRDLDPLELDVISEDASVELLLDGTNDQRKPTQSDNQAALELAKRLGRLPLALQQAVGFISSRHCSFEEYLNRWDSAQKKVVEWHDELELNYPRSIATTWELSFDEMKPEGKKALRLICWLAPDPIPKALLHKVTQVPNSFDMEEGIAELEKYSFLRWVDDKKELVQVHALVSEIARYRMSEEERIETIGRALATMELFVENQDPSDPHTWPSVYKPCRAHLGQLIEQADKMKGENPAAYLMIIFGRYLNSIAAFKEAERLFRRAIAIAEAYFGPDHPNVATGFSNLARLLSQTNRRKEAELFCRRAIAIIEAHYGPNHLNFGAELNNLASLFQETESHSAAECLFRRAIRIAEESSGPDHLNVATGLNNLASLLQATNRSKEAEPLYRRALKITEVFYGTNHPKVAIVLNNLASLLKQTNRHSEAEPLYMRALEITEEFYGPDHPDVAIRLNNLAGLLQQANRYSEAEPLHWRALTIDEASFGPYHPNVARGLNHLALLLMQTNRHSEAEPLYRRALAIDEASYGPDHPEVARVLNNLACLLNQTNRVSEADAIFERVLKILFTCKERTGIEHPHFQISLLNYTDCLSKLGLSDSEVQAKLLEIEQEAQKAAATPPDPNP